MRARHSWLIRNTPRGGWVRRGAPWLFALSGGCSTEESSDEPRELSAADPSGDASVLTESSESLTPHRPDKQPLSLELSATESSLCSGACAQIEAVVRGGNPPYTYEWTQGIGPGPGPFVVCPLATTVYEVTVEEAPPTGEFASLEPARAQASVAVSVTGTCADARPSEHDGSTARGGDAGSNVDDGGAGGAPPSGDAASSALGCSGVAFHQWGTTSSDVAYTVAIGDDGSTYVSGSSDGDFAARGNAGDTDLAVVKVAPDGSTAWRWQSGTERGEGVGASTVLPNGTLVLGCWIQGGVSLPAQSLLIALSPEGQELWTRPFDDSSAVHAIQALAADPNGALLLLAGRKEDAGYRHVLQKLTAGGTEVWARSSGPDERIAEHLASDGEGSAFVAGTAYRDFSGSPSGDSDVFVAKYDGDGDEQWTQVIDVDQKDTSGGVAVDGFGNAFIVVATQRDSSTIDGFSIIKLDPNGNRSWTRAWQRSFAAYPSAIAVDPEGGAVIAGRTLGSLLGGDVRLDLDVFLLRVEPGGEETWAEQWGSVDAAHEVPNALRIAADGTLALSGSTQGDFWGRGHSGSVNPNDGWSRNDMIAVTCRLR